MLSPEKKKTIGKYLVVILCVAILFFLLLPLLDNSPAGRSSAKVKKATPQIFTSNPLAEMARKLYGLFTPKKRAVRKPQQIATTEQAVFQARAAAQAPDQTSEYSQPVPVSYDGYDNAAFVDESGEWVLIQQTAPQSSQRGLHDVSVSDSAYEKFVRSERQARYAGGTSSPSNEIPSSQWARVWSPVKKLFGNKDSQVIAAGSAPKSVPARPLAAGNTSPQKQGAKQPKDFAKAGLDQVGWETLPPSAQQATAVRLAAEGLLFDPEKTLNEAAKNLNETAEKSLNAEDYESFTQLVDKQKQQELQKINQTLLAQIKTDAKNVKTQPYLAADFIVSAPEQGLNIKAATDCGDNNKPSAFFHNDPNMCGFALPDDQSVKPSADEIPVLTVMNWVEAGQNPFVRPAETGQTTEKSFDQRVYEKITEIQLKATGCDKKPCILVASPDYTGNDLKNSLHEGSMQLVTLPSSIGTDELRKALTADADFSEEEQTRLKTLDLALYRTAYHPVAPQELNTLPADTWVYTFASAVALPLVEQGFATPQQIAYPAQPYETFNSEVSPQEQGQAMREQINQKSELVKQLDKEGMKQMSQQAVTFLTGKKVAEAAQEAQKNLNKSLNEQMELLTP